MPRYEQLKAKSKGISHTRIVKNENKELNLKKPIIISLSFIMIVSILFTIIKKYSPMVDIAIKDFFSINHREALTLETTGTEEDNKISFLDNVPLFNFFIKSNTNETLSVMAYETNSMLEASLNNNNTNLENNSVITRESLSVFFNDNSNNNEVINNIQEKTNEIIETRNNDKPYNYIEEMIQESRKLDNNKDINNNEEKNTQNKINNNLAESNYSLKINTNNKIISEEKTINNNISSSIFYDILKPKENTTKDIKTMKPATTTYSSTPPSYIKNPQNNEPKEKYNTNSYNYYFKDYEDKYKINDENSKERIINNNNNSSKPNNSEEKNDYSSKRDLIANSSIKRPNNNSEKDYNRVINDLVNPNNNTLEEYQKDNINNNHVINTTPNNSEEKNDYSSKRDLIANSSIKRPNNNSEKDYNRVINDLVNPNNSIKNNNIVREENNSIFEEKQINREEEKKEIIIKAKKDIEKYNKSKANNSIRRDYSNERKLKNNNDEGIYLVEYDENTDSITLIFRKRDLENNNSVEESIRSLLKGATDDENKLNIISCIPKETELLDIFIEGNTVYLNFNEDFEFNPLGNEGTMLQIYQLVYTATQFEGIDNVIFLINGNFNETIGAEGAIENIAFKRFEY